MPLQQCDQQWTLLQCTSEHIPKQHRVVSFSSVQCAESRRELGRVPHCGGRHIARSPHTSTLHSAHCQEHTGKNCKQPSDQCCSTLVTGASGHTAAHLPQLHTGISRVAGTAHWPVACVPTLPAPHQHIGKVHTAAAHHHISIAAQQQHSGQNRRMQPSLQPSLHTNIKVSPKLNFF